MKTLRFFSVVVLLTFILLSGGTLSYVQDLTDPFFAESPASGSGEVLSDGYLHATLSPSMFDGEGITHSVINAALDNTLNRSFDEAPTFIDANLALKTRPTPDTCGAICSGPPVLKKKVHRKIAEGFCEDIGRIPQRGRQL